MKEKLNTILLIDDNQPTNFFHELVVKKADCAKECIAFQSGIEALEYLKTRVNGDYPQPDLIFLDINMPAMNGWEFLEEYNQLDKNQQGKVVVVMLTTSINPDDKEKASSIVEISGFMNKPLTVEMLNEEIKKHFPEKL
jgi:CheY-like chemotaxis protein